MKKTRYRLPRILAILFTAFVSLFALDVFGEGYSFWETIGAFLIHLIPSLLLVVATIIAWKWEFIGGLLFIGWGLFFIGLGLVMALRFHDLYPLVGAAPIFTPPIIIGILFMVQSIHFRKSRRRD